MPTLLARRSSIVHSVGTVSFHHSARSAFDQFESYHTPCSHPAHTLFHHMIGTAATPILSFVVCMSHTARFEATLSMLWIRMRKVWCEWPYLVSALAHGDLMSRDVV